MRPPQDIYDAIPPLPGPGRQFIHIPGIYCITCGETMALYDYSAWQPNGIDENGKPYYQSCWKCSNPRETREKLKELAYATIRDELNK